MQITTGKIQSAKKIVLYGVEGIGKSTFASKAPDTLFIDTEGSTKELDVKRTPRPTSWTMLMGQVEYVKSNPSICKTLIIDTADWAEQLCIEHICAIKEISGIEDMGYGKGYVYLEEEFGRLLNKLEDLIQIGINIILTAHAQMRKFEQPDELGAYDRWELKLQKKVAPIVKEWADIVLFANYETHVINVDGQGTEKGKNKAQGGKRIMHTAHHPCWDAKNRHGLPEKLDFNFSGVAHLFQPLAPVATPTSIPTPQITEIKPSPVQVVAKVEKVDTSPVFNPDGPLPFDLPDDELPSAIATDPLDDIPVSLRDLMKSNGVTRDEIQKVVSLKGYYPMNTPISNYDQKFVAGVLVGAWAQVHAAIKSARK